MNHNVTIINGNPLFDELNVKILNVDDGQLNVNIENWRNYFKFD